MLIDFSRIDYSEQQMLVLCNAQQQRLASLGNAINVHAHILFNEISELTFDLPRYVNGVETPGYDEVVGLQYIEWHNIGWFMLANPSTESDGLTEVKKCTAYSLDYEFTLKQAYIEEGTFPLYDPTHTTLSIMDMLLEAMPKWSVGSCDSSLYGAGCPYRTFDGEEVNVYNFMKETLQESYGCVFDFDINQRYINIRSINDTSGVGTRPVFLSQDNLTRQITVKEDTDNITTCLSVSGADGVDISTINPIGGNKIYDLSHYATEKNVGSELAEKYQQWVADINAAKDRFYNLNIQYAMLTERLLMEQQALSVLQGEYTEEETVRTINQQALQAVADGTDSSTEYSRAIDAAKEKLSDIQDQIDAQKALITAHKAAIDSVYAELQEITNRLAPKKYFSVPEYQTLNQYIKEGDLQDSTFVLSEVSTYASGMQNQSVASVDARPGYIYFMSVGDDECVVTATTGENITTYSISGGYVGICGETVNGFTPIPVIMSKLISATVLDYGNGSFVASIYYGQMTDEAKALNAQYSVNTSYYDQKGTVTYVSNTTNNEFDYDDGDDIGIAATVRSNFGFNDRAVSAVFEITNQDGLLYLSETSSTYEALSVERELYDYAMDTLSKMAEPTYEFSIDSANFLNLEEFESFKNALYLGQKLYLELDDDIVYEPILIGAEMDFEDITELKLEFGNKYSLSDPAFKLSDILDKAVTTSKQADAGKYSARAYTNSNASNAVYNFITGALDAAKNNVLAGKNQSVTIDQGGIRLKQIDDEGNVNPKQVWMVNNNIVMTSDNWDTADVAIGEIYNPETGLVDYGVVGNVIVGKILAGNNLVIESTADDGQATPNPKFRVDANGATLSNSTFNLHNGTGSIFENARLGIIGGKGTLIDADGNALLKDGSSVADLSNYDPDNPPVANFWLDMQGNAYFKGQIYSSDLSGTLSGNGNAEITGTALHIGDSGSTTPAGNTIYNFNVNSEGDTSIGYNSTTKNYNFTIDKDGNVNMNGNIVLGGSITWPTNFSNMTKAYYRYSDVLDRDIRNWHENKRDDDIYTATGFYLNNLPYNDFVDQSDPATDVYYKNEGIWVRFDFDATPDSALPSYINETYIDWSKIESPQIFGNEIYALSGFVVASHAGKDTGYGMLMPATGRDWNNRTTHGVAVFTPIDTIEKSSGTPLIRDDDIPGNVYVDNKGRLDYESVGSYVIVTNKGARIRFNDGDNYHDFVVTAYGCYAVEGTVGADGELTPDKTVDIMGLDERVSALEDAS